jgi:hypothetical protein
VQSGDDLEGERDGKDADDENQNQQKGAKGSSGSGDDAPNLARTCTIGARSLRWCIYDLVRVVRVTSAQT